MVTDPHTNKPTNTHTHKSHKRGPVLFLW